MSAYENDVIKLLTQIANDLRWLEAAQTAIAVLSLASVVALLSEPLAATWGGRNGVRAHPRAGPAADRLERGELLRGVTAT
jgi:hypothetical protein